MLETIYFLGLLFLYTAFVALHLFKKEMKIKSKYKECVDDAINNVGTNKPYTGNITL